MPTHVGPPFRCDATQSPGRSAAASFQLALRLFLRFMRPLRCPSRLLSGYRVPAGLLGASSRIATQQPEQKGGMTEKSWSIQKTGRL